MMHFRPLPPIPPPYDWRPWIKDILAALGLVAFMLASFWGFGQIADILKALGWID